MTKDYKTCIGLVDSIRAIQSDFPAYACLFTRQKEKSSLTKLGPVCFKKYLSECRMNLLDCLLCYPHLLDPNNKRLEEKFLF